ncbi:PTS sugar transporter subunit IIA [Streptococcus dysgalactiae]|uniref:PTS system mannose-specific transporter subunit IIA n=1 Tax=Streptococcus dysgalactiae subsp. dysgalactiae TaxID=99822 RepID=A0A380JW21_STRDY|nr:PTS mannose transporter subunit IIA [Streptococcus dysgalactiae]MCB2829365.1 PTS mannose transporter subunit IIA [Streptococcus dysgalactiae subsp. dysgalactiae]MCB2831662.1 PTS mannose transporter subunit IIA [Streptococcus dysgalactiae subsp. dysgalactiae]MCB2835369.1 PTS mannose transporter subunit IIA [Streptococcus dysgalactiae subsp. dysgalactiae]MCB2839441.1 PTS mannose transporter subunit IIA [Streptococcus dysgalactiae subsp. dysgalactiae]MCB2843373.1 PTS mannose transporter subuni
MKRKFLIGSHGRLASGLQSSIDILAGMGQSLEIIDAYVDDSDYTSQIDDFIAGVAADEQGLIFTDLLGGSVNQKMVTAVMASGKNNIFLITNSNLATLLSVMFLNPDEALTKDEIVTVINESQVQLVDLSPATDSEDDFFD